MLNQTIGLIRWHAYKYEKLRSELLSRFTEHAGNLATTSHRGFLSDFNLFIVAEDLFYFCLTSGQDPPSQDLRHNIINFYVRSRT